MGAVVVSASMGGYDTPHTQEEQDIDVEWLFYTDDPSLVAPSPWETVFVWSDAPTPNLAAKRYKTMPPVAVDDVVWIDANMEVTSRRFVRDALAARHDGVAAWAHPRRRCVYAEAEASVGAESQGGRYDGFDIAGQMQSYLIEGYPRNAGLFACGTIAWDLGDVRARVLGDAWYVECVRWSPQDQVSFPVVCSRLSIRPGVFPVEQINKRRRSDPPVGYLANDWLRIWPHDAR